MAPRLLAKGSMGDKSVGNWEINPDWVNATHAFTWEQDSIGAWYSCSVYNTYPLVGPVPILSKRGQ